MTDALAGVRVLDCSTGVAGPLAAMLLADFGAEVVKLEPPGGDPARRNADFAVWNRGKRSVVADVATQGGRAVLEPLLAGADICVVGTAPEDLRGSLLEPAAVCKGNPRLVYLHTPPYADRTPWAGGEPDPFLCATMGIASRQYSFDGGPVDSIYPSVVTVQGVWAATAALAALLQRERSGRGQVVTVGGVHGAMVAVAGGLTFDPSAAPVRRSTSGPGGAVPFYRTYRCGDGEWLFLAALTPQFTARAFETLGLSDLMEDERLGGGGRAALLKPENIGWITERIASIFRGRTRDEWLAALAAAGCPAGPLLDRDDWLDHPQLRAIGMRVEVDDPERGKVVMPGVPVVLTASPGAVRGPAPTLGADSPPKWTPQRDDMGASGDVAGVGPLAGIRVLDLGAIIAGPFSASLLADLGADVIKVEPPTGDSFRGPGFASYNKGQRGIVLDLRDQRAKGIFLELVRGADIVIDNYRPGVLERLGIGFEELSEVNPRIVTVTITGFGEGGPLGNEAGFDPVLQAMSGMMRAQGGDSDPVFFTVPVNDVTAAAIAAFGACMALWHREGSGRGQRVWTSLAAASALLQTEALVRFEGKAPSPVGGRDHLGPSDSDRFHQTDDGWVRVQGDASVPARTIAELALDQHLIDALVLQPDPRPDRAGWLTPGRHARFSRTERAGTLIAPSLGEHTREVLLEAGIAAGEVEALESRAKETT